jgi:hypothetical protein
MRDCGTLITSKASSPRRDGISQGESSGVAFPPEAGKRSLLSFDLEALDGLAAYCLIRQIRRPRETVALPGGTRFVASALFGVI